MALPSTDRLVKAEIRFTWNSQLVENVLHFRHAIDAPTETNMFELAGVIDDAVTGSWLALMTNSVTYREVFIESYAGDFSVAVTQAGSGVGTGGTNSMPGNATFCLSLRTAFTGRSRRGRLYTIGMDEGHQTGGLVLATYRNSWLAAINNLRTVAATANWEMVIASFISNGVPRVTGLLAPVTSVIAVDDFVDSQRRRLQGRGT